uniref:Uncharacterized protein n=1 Tax=Arion vulgaris TaxID=1028688 RepID=A0A0B6YIR8_9EUPU
MSTDLTVAAYMLDRPDCGSLCVKHISNRLNFNRLYVNRFHCGSLYVRQT